MKLFISRLCFYHLSESSVCLTGENDNSGVIIDFLVWCLCFVGIMIQPRCSREAKQLFDERRLLFVCSRRLISTWRPSSVGLLQGSCAVWTGKRSWVRRMWCVLLLVKKCTQWLTGNLRPTTKKFSCKENINSSNKIPVSFVLSPPFSKNTPWISCCIFDFQKCLHSSVFIPHATTKMAHQIQLSMS